MENENFSQQSDNIKEKITYGLLVIDDILNANNIYYTIGLTHEQCISINEILISYIDISNSVLNIIPLSTSDVDSLNNWDKEKERKLLSTI